VALIRADVSEERIASIIRVTRSGALGTLLVTANVVPSPHILVTMMMEAIRSSGRLIFQEPHGTTYQTTLFFTVGRTLGGGIVPWG
jgi:hypothetical protein